MTYYKKNRDYILNRQSEYYKNNKQKVLKSVRESTIAKYFDLPKEEALIKYNEMVINQNNLCAICKRSETKKTKTGQIRSLAIDHCHTTGKVRGLLCFDCNTTLGKVERNYNNFISYLEKA